MNKVLKDEIEDIVKKLTPKGFAGILTSMEIQTYTRQAATSGVLAGYAAGAEMERKMGDKELKKENEILRQQIKELQMELCYKAKVGI